MLEPGIQEELLFLPRVEGGRDEVCLRDLQRVAGVVAWREQKVFLGNLQGTSGKRGGETSLYPRKTSIY